MHSILVQWWSHPVLSWWKTDMCGKYCSIVIVKIGLISFRPLLFCLPFSISFCFRWFRFAFVDFVSFRFCWFRFVSFRFRWFRFVSFRFVSFSLISFRFVSFLFRFALYRCPLNVIMLLLLQFYKILFYQNHRSGKNRTLIKRYQ
jgi:hypothetical protein